MISCLAAFCPIHKRLLFTPCPITFYVYRSYKYKKNPYLAILLFARIYRGKMVTAHSVPSNEKCPDAALRIWHKICAMPAMA